MLVNKFQWERSVEQDVDNRTHANKSGCVSSSGKLTESVGPVTAFNFERSALLRWNHV